MNETSERGPDNSANNRVREIRLALGQTQVEFGKTLRLSRVHISSLETGKRRITAKLARLICAGTGANEQWLKHGSGSMFPGHKDPRLERIWRNVQSLDPALQDCVLKMLDILLEYQAAKDAER